METRVLGRDLEVSKIGFGCMGMTHAYGYPAEKSEMLRLIAETVDIGCTYFDTAECYTGVNERGELEYNEDLVGEGLAPYRHEVKLATKCGVYFTDQGLQNDARPETIRKSIDGSLKKLRTDYVDLYYLHRIDPDVPVEEVAGVMAELIEAGKITHWGLSVVDEDTIRRAHNICPVTAVQEKYSIIARKSEALFPVLEELGIGFVAYSPLASGFLSTAYGKDAAFTQKGDFRAHFKQFQSESMDELAPLTAYLKELADEKGATPAQVSLAWVLCRRPYIVPIPGTRKFNRLHENFGSAEVALSDEEVLKLEELLGETSYAGD